MHIGFSMLQVYGEAVGKIGSSDDFTDSSLVKKTVGDQYAVSNKVLYCYKTECLSG